MKILSLCVFSGQILPNFYMAVIDDIYHVTLDVTCYKFNGISHDMVTCLRHAKWPAIEH